MKDSDIKYIEIVPLESILDFMGQARTSPPSSSDSDYKESGSITLKGEVLFALNKSLKIKGMTVKFKGVVNTHYSGNTLEAPILPKLKQSLFSRTTVLPSGDHVIPFSLEIPNIYPQSLSMKRANISYKVEVSIATGLQKKSVTAEHIIHVRRHLLRCMEMAPLIETQILEHTVPTKFHYQIDAPQIVCLEQENIPVSVKYLCFSNQKPVQSIRTQLKQIELYSPVGVSKVRKIQNLADNLMMSNSSNIKYIKRTVPTLLHSIDNSQGRSTWNRPLVLHHTIQKLISPTLQSSLVRVYHELEITFQFEHKFESIKAKIPIVIASIPPQGRNPTFQLTNRKPQYPFEVDQMRMSDSFISVRIEGPSRVKEVDPVDDGESYRPNVHYSILGQPKSKVGSSNYDLHRVPREGSVPNLNSPSWAIRKFASTSDLIHLSQEHEQVQQIDRPRAEAPIAQRRRIRGGMRPIDVELANGLRKPTNNMSMVDRNLMKSKALLHQAHRQSTPPIIMHTSHSEMQTQEQPQHQQQIQTQMQTRPYNLDYLHIDDAISLLSENTSQTTRSSSTDSFDDDELRSRPPSVVYKTAPGLPAETALRPSAVIQWPLAEEMFIHDTGSPDLSPPTTIVSSSTLSRGSSMAMARKSQASIPLSAVIGPMRGSPSLASEREIFIRRAAQSGSQRRPVQLPSQAPPPSLPLPPVPSIAPPRTTVSGSAATVASTTTAVSESTNGTISPQPQLAIPLRSTYAHLQLPPLPSKAVDTKASPIIDPKRGLGDVNNDHEDDFVQHTTQRMTKLYVDDSDDEVLDPLPPIPEKHPRRYVPVVDTSRSVPSLPRLSLGTTFGLAFD